MKTSDIVTQILLGLVAIGFFNDVIKGFFQSRKVKASSNLDDANATQVIVTSTTALLGPLTTRLGHAEEKVAHLESELKKATTAAEEIVERLERCNRKNRQLEAENRRLKLLLQGEA